VARASPEPIRDAKRTRLRGKLLLLVTALIVAVIAVARGVSMARGGADDLQAPDRNAVDALAGVTSSPDSAVNAAPKLREFVIHDSLFGHSGKLRFKTLTRVSAIALPKFIETYGEEAIRRPGVHHVAANGSAPFALVVLRGFGEKQGDMLYGYRLGRWPSERYMVGKKYRNPDGFIEVMPENVELQLSAHFTLGEFLTHDQRDVWPKYLVLQEQLIDKLELVLADLAAGGVPTDHVRVLSGFRAPYYNDRIVGEGAARASRHQYGDAADVIVDANRDGRMDDLNRDGKLDLKDTQLILRAVERVEKQYPSLVGGLGLYHQMGPSGPFAHVDVRGTHARWSRQ